jgi:hypothetical protein
MKVQKTQFKLKTDDWVFKTRSEGRRMKIYIKLNKAESNQWSSIKNAVIGQGAMSDGEFAKIILFRGLNGFMEDLNRAMDEMSAEEKAVVLEEAGVEPEVQLEIPVAEETEESDDENVENSDA